MLIVTLIALMLTAILILAWMNAIGRNAAPLGCVSEEWLAEQRASRM